MSIVNQITVGFGNKCIVVQSDDKGVLPIQSVLEKLYGLFEKEDKEINKLIPDGVETVKTGEVTTFKSSKILSSLIKIGMPLETAVKTLERVLYDIHDIVKIRESISTKEIRQCVAIAIRRGDSDDDFESEEWSYRYTRKYGHDSQRIVVYNFPPDREEKEVSYSLIYGLLEDAFSRVIPKEAVDAISRQRMDGMAQYVLEFINGCDLYYFDYDILLAMIIEMSRQPPHPWLITEKTREMLYKYDSDAIKSNISEITQALRRGTQITRYCFSEIVHHASSLILEKYEWFLGHEEYSSFYILKGLIEKYRSMGFQELALMNSSIHRLARNIVLAGETIDSFYELMQRIEKHIRKSFASDTTYQDVVKYGNVAINILENYSESAICEFISSDWTMMAPQSVVETIFRILRTLPSSSHTNTPGFQNNLFRFHFVPLNIEGCSLKKNYIVVYVDKNYDLSVLKRLIGNKYKDQASAILVVCYDDENVEKTAKEIDNITDGNYWCIPVEKIDLHMLLTNDNPAEYFKNLLQRRISIE